MDVYIPYCFLNLMHILSSTDSHALLSLFVPHRSACIVSKDRPLWALRLGSGSSRSARNDQERTYALTTCSSPARSCFCRGGDYSPMTLPFFFLLSVQVAFYFDEPKRSPGTSPHPQLQTPQTSTHEADALRPPRRQQQQQQIPIAPILRPESSLLSPIIPDHTLRRMPR